MDFFAATPLAEVLAMTAAFQPLPAEMLPLEQALGRVLAADVAAPEDLPPFPRATMDGYAVRAASTFGASEGAPAWLRVCGQVAMGERPDFVLGPGEAARIATGGALPEGADSVVMVEHTETLDEGSLEVYRSVAPGQNMVGRGEDLSRGAVLLRRGYPLRPQEMGLLAALGRVRVPVFRRPRIAILSTGDEIVPASQVPAQGQIRDVNSHTLAGLVLGCGAEPVACGIAADRPEELRRRSLAALEGCDMLLLSGGSSVGVRDFTVQVLSSLPGARLLVHGITISPGKPTILAQVEGRCFWGLPGHVVSAMIVFAVVVRPFVERIAGLTPEARRRFPVSARLSRNLASAQGRTDFVRVRLRRDGETLWADPLTGKSGLIHTMVQADGLVAIGMHTEGLDKGTPVAVEPI
jgi:molybdopterin molybdotransferase